MTSLEAQQRGLLDLIKGRGARFSDEYLIRVADSGGLRMIREIAIWWREFQLENRCHFTARLLKRLGTFDTAVISYFQSHATSPFVEELSRDFLSSLQGHEDTLVRAVTQFEFALLEARAGADRIFEVSWDRNPDHVFVALEEGVDIPLAEDRWIYHMRVGRVLPAVFECSRESL
jgi:hypothetical protein